LDGVTAADLAGAPEGALAQPASSNAVRVSPADSFDKLTADRRWAGRAG